MKLLTNLSLLLICCLIGCGGATIPRQEYSQLQTPQETYEFAKKAVTRDDPEAFYYCLSANTKEQFSLSELKLGWALAGGYFYLFMDAKLSDVATPAPEKMFRRNPDTAKLTLESHNVQAAFLLHREDDKWRLVFPAPYPMPDISKIKQKTRPTWRTEVYAYYRLTDEEIPNTSRARKIVSASHRLPWRTEESALSPKVPGNNKISRSEQESEQTSQRLPKWRGE
jgi:hypothetical protein